LYKLLSCKWQANNVDGFFENSKCYKIHCFDETDDVVDVFSSHHHEVSKEFSTINYNTNDWKKFYESLAFLFEIESELSISMKQYSKDEQKSLVKKMFSQMDDVENGMENSETSNRGSRNLSMALDQQT